ncbi:fungal hydrophobin-domain-containing protein [Trametes polyzona]|nr:fungal hydrophobin-domain-containing protein [Trametes polyzona]
MFAKFATTFTALAILAVATTAVPNDVAPGDQQCQTGQLQCCQSVQTASSEPISTILGLLGVILDDLNIGVGLTCTPISVVGVGGSNSWRWLTHGDSSGHTVCCDNANTGGLINIGCLPASL